MLLDDELAAFVQSGVSVMVASRDAQYAPSLARAMGCSVVPQRGVLRIYVARSQAVQLLADVEASGVLAATFCEASTHRTIQLKAADARIVAFEEAERPRLTGYARAFGEDIAPLGFSAAFTEAFLAAPLGDETVIEFTPNAAFQQTPGPQAGATLRNG